MSCLVLNDIKQPGSIQYNVINSTLLRKTATREFHQHRHRLSLSSKHFRLFLWNLLSGTMFIITIRQKFTLQSEAPDMFSGKKNLQFYRNPNSLLRKPDLLQNWSCLDYHVLLSRTPGQRSRYSNSLRATQSGDRIPVGRGKIFSTRPDWTWDTLCVLYNWYRVISRDKSAGTWR